MVVSIKIRGVAKTSMFLKNASKEMLDKAGKAITKSGFFVQKEVVASITGQRAEVASVDTGAFRDSILSIPTKQLEVSIGTHKRPIPYAGFLEYGTSRARPRHHFKNTAKRNEIKVRDFVNKEIGKVS